MTFPRFQLRTDEDVPPEVLNRRLAFASLGLGYPLGNLHRACALCAGIHWHDLGDEMKAIRYEITGPNELGDYRLFSVVSTSWGGDATNFVCCGSWDDCECIRKKLEGRR